MNELNLTFGAHVRSSTDSLFLVCLTFFFCL